LTTVGKSEAIINGQTISYTIRRSPRAKYVRLEVRPETGLTVVIPRSYKPDQIPDLIKKKERWISGKLARYSHIKQSRSNRSLKNGDTVPYLGRDLKVVTRLSEKKIESVNLERNRLLVDLVAGENRLNLLLERWYRMQAVELLEEKVNRMSALMGLKYGRLSIRGQKTRWGSCSLKGNLNFNWKLLMVPEPVIDYVIIHELTHLKEMNHTKRFWQLVEQYCPQWRNYRKWLRDHTIELDARLSL
jgi:predicted metal-dependent hydrolase